MLNYLAYFLISFTTTVGTVLFFKSDCHRVVYRVIQDRYRRFKSLNKLISNTPQSKNRSKTLVFIISTKMLAQALYLSLIQYMNNSVRKLDKNTYEVSYVINGRIYKMITRPTRGPTPILQVSNEQNEDVTYQVLPYMGPQYDWHNNKLAPEFFGYQTLTFELADGTEHTYDKDRELNWDD